MIIFVGAVASNLIASYLETTLKPYSFWVWAVFVIALIATVVVEIRRRTHSSNSDTLGNEVNANANRSAAVGGNVNNSTIEIGDKKVVGNEVGGDSVGRDKIVHINQTSSSASATLTQLHEVPPPPADFTGREDELRELLTAIQVGGVTISGLQGMGGIGKSVLAFKLVELLKPRYPDAQFFLDLKGASTQPLSVAEALAHVVRAYHPTAKLPESESELRGLYLSVLDGQHALLLMDNAANAEQVEPLIPPAGCLLLVTSRQHFTVPGLAAKNLDTLSAADARELLLTIAPRIGPQADEIATLCGHLPLALRLAAAAIVRYRNLSPTDYVRRLHDRQQRLQLIDASLSLSYELLSEELRERWRWLAVFPDTFAEDAAAALWEVEVDQAKYILGELMAGSLVEWNESSDRYRLHDLARLFADTKLNADERTVGQKRFATHYKDVLAAANELYKEGDESLLRGLALFDLEWSNIEAGHAWVAVRTDVADVDVSWLAITYPDAGVFVLDLRQHSRERIRWLEISLGVARRLQDRAGEAAMLCNLGNAYAALRETHRAIEFYDQALLIHREIGNRQGEGNVLGNLGIAHRHLSQTNRAIQLYEQQLAIVRATGDRRGEGNAVGNIGNAYLDLGEYHRAIQFYEQQLAIVRKIGDRRGEGNALWNMSLALYKLNEHAQAVQHAVQALTLYEQIEDPKAAKVRTKLAEWREQTNM